MKSVRTNFKKGISLCMIVRNEERSIRKSINSCKDFVNEIIVVDTGSSDKTIEYAKELDARVYEHEWVDDFSVARNFSISYAKYSWILILDADEILDKKSAIELLSIVQTKRNTCAFELRVVSDLGSINYNEARVIRFFKNDRKLYFENRIHEQITGSLNKIKAKVLRSNVKIIHDGYNEKNVDQKAKQSRNIKLLKLMLVEQPNYYYWPYSLGVSYLAINDNKNGLKYLNQSLSDSLHPNLKAAIINLIAGVYKSKKKWNRVMSLAERSVEFSKNQFFAYCLLYDSYNELKDFNSSNIIIDKLISIFPNLKKNGSDLNSDNFLPLNNIKIMKGLSLYNLKKLDKSKDVFEEVFHDLNILYREKTIDDAQLINYKEVIKNLVGLSRDLNDAISVVKYLNEYLLFFPEDFDAYKLMGEAYLISKDNSNALKSYLKAYSIRNNDFEVIKKITAIFTMMGNQKKAEEWLFKMADHNQ